MYPHERSLVNEMKDRPFALIGVNSDRDLEAIREIVKEKNLNWRSFQNQPEGATMAISKHWAVEGWPTLIVLDEELRIRHRSHNGQAASDLAVKLVEELEKKSARKD
ncbi:MAG: thioredoxin-like domain-containing protein [Planctomycetota bacterium]